MLQKVGDSSVEGSGGSVQGMGGGMSGHASGKEVHVVYERRDIGHGSR